MTGNKHMKEMPAITPLVNADQSGYEAMAWEKKINRTFPVVWIDMKRDRDLNEENELSGHLPESMHICRVSNSANLSKAIQSLSPSLLCFDFDIPDEAGLSLLQETKQDYPALPIVVLTDYHSEELAIWAFHVGVRDFIVKPVRSDEFVAKIMTLTDLHIQGRGPLSSRRCLYPQIPVAIPIIEINQNREGYKIRPALMYVEVNFHKKISLNTLARLCYLSPSQFCRTFRKELGVTFSEYLTRYRVAKAREFLARPHASIKEVAFAVGYNDLSHFTRMFRRYVAMSPSEYKRKTQDYSNG